MVSLNDRSKAIEKIIIILSLLILYILLIILVKTPSAISYEISIYEIYPKYFWFLILFSILGGQFILVKNSIYPNYCNFSGLFGIPIILLMDLILICIPLTRNYALFGREDVLSHAGFVVDILNRGYIGNSNSYPIVHLICAQLTLITGMHKFMIIQLIPVIYSLLHLLSFYVLAKFVSRDWKEFILTLGFAFILVLNTTISQIASYSVFAPYSQLLLIFPLFIYIYLRSITFNSNYAFRILTIIAIFYCVFAHPLSGIAFIVMFLAWDSIRFILKYKQFNFISNYNLQSSKNYILLYIIAYSMWGSYIYYLIRSISGIYYSILGVDETSELNSYVDLTNRLRPDLYDLITAFITNYGQVAIIGTLLIVSIYYIFKEGKRNDNYIFLVLPISICGLIFLGISFVLIFTGFAFPFGRIFAWALLLSPLIIAHASYTYLTKIKNQVMLYGSKLFVIMIALCFILFSISYLSLFSLYSSPITISFNQQVTISELTGMEWFFDTISFDLPIFKFGISPLRFYYAIYGFDFNKGKIKEKIDPKSYSIPDHFGYDKSININYGDCYIVINYIARNMYQAIHEKRFGDKYKDKWSLLPEDFIKLASDPSVNRIYSNGNLECYIIS